MASKYHQWFKSYGHFTEGVDFAYWWSFIGEGSAPAACTAGLFKGESKFYMVKIYFKKISLFC